MSTPAVAFYDTQAREGGVPQHASAIEPVRRFNNWVKDRIINEAMTELVRVTTKNGGRIDTLDLACGRGGDMGKWARAIGRVHAPRLSVTFMDASTESLKEAHRRATDLKVRFAPAYVHGDMVAAWPTHRVPLAPRFHFVSCQFALHYAFATPQTAQATLNHIAAVMLPRMPFVCTVPNAHRVRALAMTQCAARQHMSITPSATNPRAYTFWLRDAVDHVEEYYVEDMELISCAATVGLTLASRKSFAQFAEDYNFPVAPPEVPEGMRAIVDLYDVWVFVKL